MSSTGNSGGRGGGGGGRRLYFCHQCNRTVSITPSPTSDLVCPTCGGGFLEEYESPNPNPNPFSPFSSDSSSFSASFGTGLPLLFSTSVGSGGGGGGMEFQNPNEFASALFGGPTVQHRSSSPAPFGDADAFNPFQFLQSYLQNLRAGGANIQFVIENNSGGGGGEQGFRFGLPTNLGDYFIGPGLEQLIQQLAENDPNRYGTPPASKSVVKELPNVKITYEVLASDSSQCAVCKDTFELGVEAKQMPCKHIYHSECILPWLEMHNTCPVCRYELPTDDPDYEQRSRENRAPANPPANPNVAGGTAVSSGTTGGSGSGSSGTSQENPQTSQSVERRFRISLPWPFRASGSPAETSNSGSGNNNNNSSNDGQSNSGGSGNRQSGMREDNLD